MPDSTLAQLALLAAIPANVLLFYVLRPTVAVAIGLVASAHLLPERTVLDLPGFPELSKYSIAAAAVYMGGVIRCPQVFLRSSRSKYPLLIFGALLVCNLATAILNSDPQILGYSYRPGLTWVDGTAVCISDLFSVWLPFHVVRLVTRRGPDLIEFCRVFVLCALVASAGAWIESVMSPQLHRWVYGFHPHSRFGQTFRYGGWRPTLFLGHGLDVAKFFFAALIVAVGLRKSGGIREWPMGRSVWPYLAILVVALRSSATWIWTLVALPLAVVSQPLQQARLATILCVLVLAYPAVRVMGLVPLDTLQSVTMDVFGEERTESLTFRIVHEDALMARGLDRPVFGWGKWGRSRIHNYDGQDTSVTDGLYIRLFGQRGAIALYAYMLILLAPCLAASRAIARTRRVRVSPLAASLCLVSALLGLDLIFNGLHDYFQFVYAALLANLASQLNDNGLK